jgi:hypothetical protein
VLVLDGAAPGAAQRSALAEYASRLGGGVLYAGGSGRAGDAVETVGDRIRWTLPAELAPLPGGAVRSSSAPLGRLAPGSFAGAASPEGVLLALRAAGRGREASLGLTETWRWRMEAGRIAEHREFWRSLVDWLASAPREPVVVEVPEALGPPGSPVEVRVFAPALSGELPRELYLARPDGSREALPLASDPLRPGALRARFVPAAPGVYALGAGSGAPLAGFRAAADSGEAVDPWARLALLADRSGGAALPADSFAAALARREAALGRGGGRTLPSLPVLLALAALLAVAEWTVRRLRGRA